MSVVTVQEIGQSQSGKSTKVKANGKWYFLGKGCPTPSVGVVLEIKEGSFDIDGKSYATIEAWRPVGQTQPAPQQQSAQTQQRPAQAPVDASQAFVGQGFISNVVGHAIAAGIIKEPGQILAWFNGAKAALENKPAPQPFDDRIPFGDEDDRQASASGRW